MSNNHLVGEVAILEPLEGVQAVRFSGGEPHLNVPDPGAVRGSHAVVDVRGGSFDALGAGLVAADALRRCGAASVSLSVPYLPGARQDRGVPFTAKVYADIINAARFDAVVAVDPHSLVMPALLERFIAIDPVDIFPASLLDADGPVVVICPDAGAVKRAESVASRFGLDVVYARKHRNPLTGKLSGTACEPLPAGSTGVVVDDICDGGATFVQLAAAIGTPPPMLRLWTTHGIYARGVSLIHEHYAVVAATDSLPGSALADLVVPVMPAVSTALCNQLGIARHELKEVRP